jgi:hypothetical protein
MCCLFNDAVSSSDYNRHHIIMTLVGLLMHNELERIWKEVVVA